MARTKRTARQAKLDGIDGAKKKRILNNARSLASEESAHALLALSTNPQQTLLETEHTEVEYNAEQPRALVLHKWKTCTITSPPVFLLDLMYRPTFAETGFSRHDVWWRPRQ